LRTSTEIYASARLKRQLLQASATRERTEIDRILQQITLLTESLNANQENTTQVGANSNPDILKLVLAKLGMLSVRFQKFKANGGKTFSHSCAEYGSGERKAD